MFFVTCFLLHATYACFVFDIFGTCFSEFGEVSEELEGRENMIG